jgi:hypothetical protein
MLGRLWRWTHPYALYKEMHDVRIGLAQFQCSELLLAVAKWMHWSGKAVIAEDQIGLGYNIMAKGLYVLCNNSLARRSFMNEHDPLTSGHTGIAIRVLDRTRGGQDIKYITLCNKPVSVV